MGKKELKWAFFVVLNFTKIPLVSTYLDQKEQNCFGHSQFYNSIAPMMAISYILCSISVSLTKTRLGCQDDIGGFMVSCNPWPSECQDCCNVCLVCNENICSSPQKYLQCYLISGCISAGTQKFYMLLRWINDKVTL